MNQGMPDTNVTDQPAPVAPVTIDPPLKAESPEEKGVFTGRLNRLGYLLANVYWTTAFVVIAAIALVLLLINNSAAHVAGYAVSLGLIVYAVVWTVFTVGFVIRRLHDCGLTGWVALLLLVPGAAHVFQIVLLLIPGTPGPNAYGAGPQPTLGFRDVSGL